MTQFADDTETASSTMADHTSTTKSTTCSSSSTATATTSTFHPDDPHPIVPHGAGTSGSSGGGEKHAHFSNDDDYSSSDDDGDDDDDEETLERQRAFKQAARSRGGNVSHPAALGGAHPHPHLLGATGVEMIQERDSEGKIVCSLRRFDEFGDFRTRSERTRSERSARAEGQSERSSLTSSATSIYTGEYNAAAAAAAAASNSKPKVQFLPEGDVSKLHDIPELEDDDYSKCFMTDENWRSIDMDVELTRKRWENHCSGSIKFDTQNNCLRGLETMLMSSKEARERDRILAEHQREILQAQIEYKEQQQKLQKEGKPASKRDMFDHLRVVSLKTSEQQLRKARGRGLYDAEECSKVWSGGNGEKKLSLKTKCDYSSRHLKDSDDSHEKFFLEDIHEKSFPGGYNKNKKDDNKKKNPLLQKLSKVFGGGNNNNNNKKK